MLTERQLLILKVTVDDYIQSAQPVGSNQLSKKSELPFSPATIRNEMADLEGLGFLEKTHTSSGRIPSEKGYRYYVDHMLTPRPLPKQDIQQLQSIFEDKIAETEEIIKRSAMILSELTNYTSILLGPDVRKHTVKKLSIVPLTMDTAVAIIVTDNGHVENRVFTIPEGLDPADIEKMVNILNDRLVGVSLNELHLRLEQETLTVFKQHVNRYGELFSTFRKAVISPHEDNVYYGGKLNILRQPDFHDLHKIRDLMNVMEESKHIPMILPVGSQGLHIRIGSENALSAMEDCSVITVSYDIGEEQTGSIAIVGPKRMDYKRVVTLLDTLSGELSKQLTRMIQGK
ncbi:heat-inducible transcriptional repressor HrcA [Planococcus shenhongbingii]|uniref:Heat-inducible transcription repressor HrcA n=1 Tax=Planococcus shenhongbingii TaxID=3058398 RepID=A0ABT8NE82_9BACL|nr:MULTISPECIES: heat-inducible transcriptional repressor HrcA [unclassified Planococcus (in: firmicutes)]MDN7245810.1 heat-inducible transcriptional repressor HrcA [Planococcus sp. N017]WKA60076.1 heat-inducible transcriptional repressor HrcA [Planococcus sp. N016]